MPVGTRTDYEIALAKIDRLEGRVSRQDDEIAELLRINARLQGHLNERPTQMQADWIKEENKRVESLYQAAIARNEILRRKLREAGLE